MIHLHEAERQTGLILGMSNTKPVLRERQEATTAELKQYKLLVDSVKDYAIFLLDANGHIKSWNKGAQKNKGYTADEIIGKHFSIFYMPEDVEAQKPEKELELAKKFGRAEDEDWRVRKDGTKFWASVVITALYEDDKLVGFAKVTRDLTDRKLHEDELRKANILLRSQREELRALNNSKDEFISLASHQLRTPATAIKQLLGMCLDGFYDELTDKQLLVIRKAYESNDRQISIVNSLLKVAQVDAGKVKLNLRKCDIAKLIEQILSEMHETFTNRKQSVDFTNKAANFEINVDEQNLRMAIENLVSNASKYTYAHGQIKIMLSETDRNRLLVSIEDNGVGIATSDISSLFKKFSRVPNDLSDEVGGTGLGLYWANKIVELHGGRIEVCSELNEGTTFDVFLPAGR